MTGAEFERKVCEVLRRAGFWALNIPRSKAGQQPFDVVAVRGESVLAVDCKVVSGKRGRFPLDRIEDNQWLGFQKLRLCSPTARIGIVVYHEATGLMHYIQYEELVRARADGRLSLWLTSENLWRISNYDEHRVIQ